MLDELGCSNLLSLVMYSSRLTYKATLVCMYRIPPLNFHPYEPLRVILTTISIRHLGGTGHAH